MNKLLFSFFIGVSCLHSFGQSKSAAQVAEQCDSIFQLLVKEKDETKRNNLNLSFYSASVDGFPLQLLLLRQKLLNAAKKNNDSFLESAGISAAAQGYRLSRNYVKALEYHRKALALAEALGNKVLPCFALNQISHIYKDRFYNEKDREYLHISLIKFFNHFLLPSPPGKVPGLV